LFAFEPVSWSWLPHVGWLWRDGVRTLLAEDVASPPLHNCVNGTGTSSALRYARQPISQETRRSGASEIGWICNRRVHAFSDSRAIQRLELSAVMRMGEIA
jgi:hypothetical protein